MLVLIVAAYLLYTTVFANNPNCGGSAAKEKLTGVPAPTEYISGSSSWTSNPDNLKIAMQTFYEDTGIAPYVYDISNEDAHTADELQKIADDFYEEHFNDEKHFLMVFQAGSDALAAYHIGTDAKTILDDAAMKTFNDQLKSAFKNKDVKEADTLAYVYITCSSQVMVTPGSNLTFIIIIAVVLILYGGYNYMRNKKNSSGSDDGSSGQGSFKRTFL